MRREKRGGLVRSVVRLVAACAGLSAPILCLAEKAAPFESLYREAYQRRLRSSGPEHPATIASLVRLAALLCAHSDAEAAEPLLRKALAAEGASDALGPDVFVELAATLAALGRNIEAEQFYRRSLERMDPSPRSARILASIAKLCEAGGDTGGARQAYLQALERFEDGAPLADDDRKAKAAALNDLGLLLEAQGEIAEAEAVFRKSAEAHAAAFGNGHPSTAAVHANLAGTLAMRGEAARAATLLARSLAILRAAHGARNDDVARLHNRLGEIYEAMGRLEQAEQEYLSALEAWREPSVSRGLALANLGRLAGVGNDPAAAEAALVEAIGLLEAGGDAHAPDLAAAFHSYGSLLLETGRLDAAEPVLAKALAIRERELGASHPDVALSLVGLAGVLHVRGNLEQAGPLYRRALDIQQALLGAQHPDVGETLYNLAHLWLAMGNKRSAKGAFERAAEILSAAYGPRDPVMDEIRAALQALR